MSTPTPQAPAGWYQDPDGSGLLRWWDGTAWTEHRAGTTAATTVSARPALPEGTRVDTVWSWLVALLPLIGIIPLLVFDIHGYLRAALASNPHGMFASLGGYVILLPLTWIAYGLVVFFAYRDWLSLKRAGVVRPFHWAFGFAGSLVYLIGRTVILRKVSKGGAGPLVVVILVYLVVMIIAFYWTYFAMVELIGPIPVHYRARL